MKKKNMKKDFKWNILPRTSVKNKTFLNWIVTQYLKWRFSIELYSYIPISVLYTKLLVLNLTFPGHSYRPDEGSYKFQSDKFLITLHEVNSLYLVTNFSSLGKHVYISDVSNYVNYKHTADHYILNTNTVKSMTWKRVWLH